MAVTINVTRRYTTTQASVIRTATVTHTHTHTLVRSEKTLVSHIRHHLFFSNRANSESLKIYLRMLWRDGKDKADQQKQ